MVVSFNNDDGFINGGHQQQEYNVGNRPQTVSSLSSLDTTGYEHDITGIGPSNVQQSTSTSLSPLPSVMEAQGSNSSVVTSSTTVAAMASNGDTTFAYTATETNNNNTCIGGPSVAQTLDTGAPSAISLAGTVTMQISPSTGVLVSGTPNTNTVPEFLYQLTKMLTDNNRDIIEWSNGKIEVHSPHKLETHVLNRYFRHSKFASFQRQLNYFGFRKLAGKGKMAPCSYVNDATTDELGSLLLIKRKQGNEPKTKPGGKKRGRGEKEMKPGVSSIARTAVDAQNPALGGIVYRSTSIDNTHSSMSSSGSNSLQQSQKALARVAVGKGVRHGYVPQQSKNHLKSGNVSSSAVYTQQVQPVATALSSPVEDSLNALTQNFNESLNETTANTGVAANPNQYVLPAPAPVSANSVGPVSYVPGSLHRDDSLVDLAMIPIPGDGNTSENNVSSTAFSFVDFPFDSNIFLNEEPHT